MRACIDRGERIRTLHRVTVALALGDAGPAIALARQVPLDKIGPAGRKASLFVDVAPRGDATSTA